MTNQPLFADNPPAPGHNKPPAEKPTDPIERFRTTKEREIQTLRDRVNELKVGLARVPETITKDSEKLASDFMDQCKALSRDINKAHKEHKAPHLARGKVIDEMLGPKSPLVTGFKDILAPVQNRWDAYVRAQAEATRKAEEEKARAAEAERIRQEEEARQREAAAAEAARQATSQEERQAAAHAFDEAEAARVKAQSAAEKFEAAKKRMTEPFKIKGDYGSTSFITTRKVLVVDDLDAIPAGLVWPYVAEDAKRTAIRKALEAGVVVRGARLEDEQKTVTRSA